MAHERQASATGGPVGRLTDQLGAPSPELQPDVIDLLFTVTSFETFDVLAGADKTPADAVPVSGTSPAPP
jgi:hypothetical protein